MLIMLLTNHIDQEVVVLFLLKNHLSLGCINDYFSIAIETLESFELSCVFSIEFLPLKQTAKFSWSNFTVLCLTIHCQFSHPENDLHIQYSEVYINIIWKRGNFRSRSCESNSSVRWSDSFYPWFYQPIWDYTTNIKG